MLPLLLLFALLARMQTVAERHKRIAEVDVFHDGCFLLQIKLVACEIAKPQKLKKPEATLPTYTTEELSGILERRAETSAVIDECERMLGKMFSTSETAKVVGLIDYLGLDGEYIINLCAHCARIGKKSLRYVETVAFDLYDRGIISVEALDAHRRCDTTS